MSENKPGSQWTPPSNKPAKEKGGPLNEPREDKGEEIIGGARQEDQLDELKPDPETSRKIDSQPVPDEDDGDSGDRSKAE